MQPLAVTMGEPAGIGAEITLAAWTRLRADGPRFVLLDDADRVAALAARIGSAAPVRKVASMAEGAAAFASALPVLHRPLPAPVTMGRPDAANAGAVIAAIEEAVALTRAGEAASVVTNPIQKAVLTRAGFPHPGHTEFLAALAGPEVKPVMMLACPGLRTVPVTVHLPLRVAIDRLTTEAIVVTARIVNAALRDDFGIALPRLAIAGLNPHAGENGTLGEEDAAIAAPAVAALRAEGIAATGPHPTDTLFTPHARATYDAALCLTHDHAMIPVKTLDMDGGVNVTLGLPFVRTSPDHGTALDIAGTGRAAPGSLIAAMRMAAEMAANRQMRARSAA